MNGIVNVRQVIAGFCANENNTKQADVSKIRRALRTGSEELVSNTPVSVIDSMKLYRMGVKKQRETAKNTDLAKKKLKYSFKKISSRIISSKTSAAAREAVSQARREIQRLKAARRTGKYDEEELEAAMDHAKAMERIARKKVRHLEEEEMAKRCERSESDEAAGSALERGDDRDPAKDEIAEIRSRIGDIQEKSDDGEYIETGKVTNDMLSTICSGMEEMLAAIEELNDLMNELMSAPSDMDPGDLAEMKIKHRNREMKEITKADADYLKAIFEHYDEQRSGGGMTFGASYEEAASASVIDVAL